MDTVFNIKRFVNLLKREFTYIWKTLLYIVVGLIIYYIAAKLLDSMWQFQLMSLLPMIAIAFVICGTPFINKNLNKANFTPFLTIPTSNFERWLLLWAKSVLIMPILIIGTILLLNQISPIHALDRIIDTNHILDKIHVLLAFQSVFFLGYIYFKERTLVKSAVAMTIAFMLIYFISKVVISQFYPEILEVKRTMDIFYILNFDGFYQQATVSYVETGTTAIYEICSWIIKLIFPLGLWILSYIRIREREI